jgi:hypothetical protein
MGIHSAAILDKKYLEMLKLLNVYLNHFPRYEKFALANRIRNTAYELYDLIVEGQKRYHKKTTLISMDIKHEQLRMQIRLAHELGYFRFHDGKTQKQSPEEQELHRLMTLQLLIDEIGRMIGGWIVYQREQEKGGATTCA